MILFVIQGNGSWPGQQNANPGIVQNRLLKTNKRKQTQNSSRLLLWQLEVSDRRGKLGYKQARHPITRKDRQICLYGCTRCFSNRGRHRHDLPWDIKKNLNQHPMTTYSAEALSWWWASWRLILSSPARGRRARAAPPTGLPGNHVQPRFQVNNGTKHKGTHSRLNLVGWWGSVGRVGFRLVLLWPLAWNLFLPASNISPLWAVRFSPGKCSERTERVGRHRLSVLKGPTQPI